MLTSASRKERMSSSAAQLGHCSFIILLCLCLSFVRSSPSPSSSPMLIPVHKPTQYALDDNLVDDNPDSPISPSKINLIGDKELLKERLGVPGVSVTVYHHQAIYDPMQDLKDGKPWTYLGHGYGLHYTFDDKGKASKEKGFQYIKALGRELCREGIDCQPKDKADNKLRKHVFKLINNHSSADLPAWFQPDSHRKPKVDAKHKKNSIQLFNSGWKPISPKAMNAYNHRHLSHNDLFDYDRDDGVSNRSHPRHNHLSSLNNVFV